MLQSGNKITIIIDALNQLDTIHQSHLLRWLPMKLPANIKIILSCLPGDCLDVLKNRSVPEISVGTLSEADRMEIVSSTLGQHKKKLEDNQMQLLLKKKEAVNPLYLIITCEELRGTSICLQYG